MALQTPTLHLPYPQSTDSADVPRDIAALANAIDPLGIAPVGAMFMWPAATPPADVDGTGRALWLLCNGQTIDAALYPKLATLLGQAGGLVTVPDMRDVFPVGAGATALLSTGGAAAVALTAAQMPAHAHALTDPGHAHSESAAGVHSHGGYTGARDRSQAHGHTIQSNWAIYNANGGTAVSFSSPGGGTMYRTNIAADAVDPADHLHPISADGSHAHTINGAATGITMANTGGGGTHENRPPFRALNFILRAG